MESKIWHKWIYLQNKKRQREQTCEWQSGGSREGWAGSLELVQFSRSVVSNSLWPHELQHTRPPCPSPTLRVYSDSCSLSWWCHSTIKALTVSWKHCRRIFHSGREESFQYQFCKTKMCPSPTPDLPRCQDFDFSRWHKINASLSDQNFFMFSHP